MKKTEIILIIIAFIALVLNLLLISGGEVATVLSLSALSIIYMYLSFALFNDIRFRDIFKKASYKGISALRIVGAIITGLALAITIVGILFKFQSWAGASINLAIGLTVLGVVAIVGTIKYFKSRSVYYLKILRRIAAYGGLGTVLLLLPENTLIELKYRNYPDYVKAFKNASANPDDPALWSKVKLEHEKITDAK